MNIVFKKFRYLFECITLLGDKLSKSEVVEIPSVSLIVMIQFEFGFGTWHDLEAK